MEGWPTDMVSDWIAVAAGGALGALLRFWVSESMPSDSFPWGTLTVNLVGSILLGEHLERNSSTPLWDRFAWSIYNPLHLFN